MGIKKYLNKVLFWASCGGDLSIHTSTYGWPDGHSFFGQMQCKNSTSIIVGKRSCQTCQGQLIAYTCTYLKNSAKEFSAVYLVLDYQLRFVQGNNNLLSLFLSLQWMGRVFFNLFDEFVCSRLSGAERCANRERVQKYILVRYIAYITDHQQGLHTRPWVAVDYDYR